MSGPKRFTFVARGAVYWGVIWAVGVAIVEYLTLAPVENWGPAQALVFWLLYWVVPYWCVVGVLFVRLADNHERIASRSRLLAAFLTLCVLSAALHPLLAVVLIGLTKVLFPPFQLYAAALRAVEPTWDNWASFCLYHLWDAMFYGALLMAARIFTVRIERTRHRLHQCAMARSRAEALLDDARLQALQSQIDPNLLLDSMQELEQRYRASPELAERLLEALVEFLRDAMHGLRVPVSTLDAELHLARVYAQLQKERGLNAAWRIVEEAASPAATQLKFPSLLMLQLLALGENARPAMLRVRTERGQTVLSLHGLSRSLSTELRQQVKARLHALYGDRFQFESHSSNPHHLRITLPPPLAPLGESRV